MWATAAVVAVASTLLVAPLLLCLLRRSRRLVDPTPPLHAHLASPRQQRPRPLPRDVLVTSLWSCHFTTLRLNALFTVPARWQPVVRGFYLAGTGLTLLGCVGLGLALVRAPGETVRWVVGWLVPAEWILGVWERPVDEDGGSLYFSPMLLFTLQYIGMITLALGWHELGHGMAAAAWNLPLRSLGIGMLGLFPWAAVHFRETDLCAAGSTAQLAVAVAGVWHNVLGAALAAAWLRRSGRPHPAGLRVLHVPPALAPHVPRHSTLVSVNGVAAHPAWLRRDADTRRVAAATAYAAQLHAAQLPAAAGSPLTCVFAAPGPPARRPAHGDPGPSAAGAPPAPAAAADPSHRLVVVRDAETLAQLVLGPGDPSPRVLATLLLAIHTHLGLALVNLVPLPKLDGMHIFRSLGEFVRGQKTTPSGGTEKGRDSAAARSGQAWPGAVGRRRRRKFDEVR